MAFNDGGKVTFVDKGIYDPNVTYYRLDYVKHNGSIFVCRKTSLGNAPNASVDTEYWMKFIDSSSINLMYLYDNVGAVATQRAAIQFMNGALVDNSTTQRTEVTIGITDTEWTSIQTILGTAT